MITQLPPFILHKTQAANEDTDNMTVDFMQKIADFGGNNTIARLSPVSAFGLY